MSDDELHEKLRKVYRTMIVVHRWQTRPTESPSPAEIAAAMLSMEAELASILRQMGRSAPQRPGQRRGVAA